MIAYFDTSAIVPLVVQEPTSEALVALWDEVDHAVTVTLARVEAASAVARARRSGRLVPSAAATVERRLARYVEQMDLVAVDDDLVDVAVRLAGRHGLRGYDAVHLAAAVTLGTEQVVVATNDAELRAAALTEGFHVAP